MSPHKMFEERLVYSRIINVRHFPFRGLITLRYTVNIISVSQIQENLERDMAVVHFTLTRLCAFMSCIIVYKLK